MSKRFGVIDLGTNTFHLLIVTSDGQGGFAELHRERRFIKLAENGIKTIGDAPFQRGMDALIHFRSILEEYEVSQVKAFGTAGLRTASNGALFVAQAREFANIDIELIPGSEEARLIHLGVSQVVPFGTQKGLIMDIGGGSVEFIIADQNQVYWAQSFPIGVAVLRNAFHQLEPITQKEIHQIYQHLDSLLVPFLSEIQNHQLFNLIGASGTFDVLELVLDNQVSNTHHSTVRVADFWPLYEKVVAANLEERFAMEGIPSNRADMIVVAMVLIKYILQKTNIEQIDISAFAMKEGILSEMMK